MLDSVVQQVDWRAASREDELPRRTGYGARYLFSTRAETLTVDCLCAGLRNLLVDFGCALGGHASSRIVDVAGKRFAPLARAGMETFGNSTIGRHYVGF